MKRISEFKGYCTSVRFNESSKTFIQFRETHPFLEALQIDTKVPTVTEKPPPQLQPIETTLTEVVNTMVPEEVRTATLTHLVPKSRKKLQHQSSKTGTRAKSKPHRKTAV